MFVKICLIFFSLSWSVSFGAATDDQREYRDLPHSLIEWERVNPAHWTDLRQWKYQRFYRDRNPHWRRDKIVKMLDESMGRVMGCIGTCRIYRGHRYFTPQARSLLREGDEVETGKDGHLWGYLFDGTIFRLSPHTSLALLEFNISPRDFFYYVRLGYGEIVWLNRDNPTLQQIGERETDTLFLPFRWVDEELKLKRPRRSQIYATLNWPSNKAKKIADSLQRQWSLNNASVENPRRTFTIIAMPNGMVHGTDLKLHLIVNSGPGGGSLIKDRSIERQAPYVITPNRGRENGARQVFGGQWFSIDQAGKYIAELDNEAIVRSGLHLSEFVTRRIDSVLMAREFFYQRYTVPIYHSRTDADSLAKEFGWRYWEPLATVGSDLARRKTFITNYALRHESFNLAELNRRADAIYSEPFPKGLARQFYKRALESYFAYPNSISEHRTGESLGIE